MNTNRLLVILAAASALVAGCAGPRTVHLISSNPTQVKMLYYRQGGIFGIGAERGIVKCDFKSDSLDNCRDIAIDFIEEEGEEAAQ